MIYKVLDVISQAEKNFDWDVEAQGHHYDVKWKSNKLVLSLTDSYSFYDECGDVQHKDNTHAMQELDCIAEEFINFTIQVYEAKLEIEKYNYTEYENGFLIPKIKIHPIMYYKY